MRVEVERLPQSQIQLEIEIDPDTLGQAVNKAYHRLAGRYTVPGFRPGKAPRAVLERVLGPELLISEAADICMNEAYAQAIKDHDLHPIGQPEVQSPKGDEIHPEDGLVFTATLYVRPQAQLGDYQALRIAPSAPDVTSEDVDRVLQSYQEQQASWEPIEDRPAAAGDQATLRLLATVGDDTLVDQASWQYVLSDSETPNLPIPGLSDHVLGMRIGEIHDVTIDLAEDYTPPEFAGQQMALHLELLRLTRKVTTAIDDDFARSLGEFDSIDALRQSMQANLQSRARREAMDTYVDTVVRQVVDQAVVETPPPLVDEEIDNMMRQLQDTVERERRLSMDTYLRIIGKTIEELREEARPRAVDRVRTNLVLDAVADAEDVRAPEEEVDEQIRQINSSPTRSTKDRRRLLASADLRVRIEHRLRRQHAITRLLEITKPQEPSGESEQSGTLDEGGVAVTALASPVPSPIDADQSEAAAASDVAEYPSDQQNEQES